MFHLNLYIANKLYVEEEKAHVASSTLFLQNYAMKKKLRYAEF